MGEYGILDHLYGQAKINIMKTYNVKLIDEKGTPIGKSFRLQINNDYYRYNSIILINDGRVIIIAPWYIRYWIQIVIGVVGYAIGIIMGILLLSNCTSQKISTDSRYKTFRYNIPSEYFFYQDKEIYHVSSRLDTTLLDRRDIKTLKIDSLTIKYLEFKENEVRKRNDPKIAKEN